jgi:hypothetical protein
MAGMTRPRLPAQKEAPVTITTAQTSRNRRKRVAVVMGTRPEAIKMAPVVHALRRQGDRFETVVVATAQHRHMLCSRSSASSRMSIWT